MAANPPVSPSLLSSTHILSSQKGLFLLYNSFTHQAEDAEADEDTLEMAVDMSHAAAAEKHQHV